MPMTPRSPGGRPWSRRRHVLPPSVDFRIALSGPPLLPPNGVRLPLIRGGVDDVRVGRIEPHFLDASVLVHEQHVLPRSPTIGGLEESPLTVGPPQVTHRSDVHDVVVSRIQDDAVDELRVGKPHGLPRLAAIGRLEDALPPGLRSPRADPDEIGIVLRHGHVADADDVILRVEEDLPRRPVVDRLPEAARGRGGIDDRGIRLVDRHIVDTAGVKRRDRRHESGDRRETPRPCCRPLASTHGRLPGAEARKRRAAL